MLPIVINGLGAAILAVGFGAAFAIGHLIGNSSEWALMILAGPVITTADALYRLKSSGGHWFRADGGGMLFFLPLWAWGIFWLVLGIGYAAIENGA